MPIGVVFFDCDGTLTRVRSSWEYLHRKLNLWTDKADAYQEMFREGKIDYFEFCRKDALLWRDLPVTAVNDVINTISYQQNAARTVGILKSMGIVTVIISSGLSLLVERVKKDLSIDMALSNELVSRDGFITGDLRINVEYNRKGPLVRQVLGLLGLKRENSCAVGDGDGDAGMFNEVGLPIGFSENGSSPSCSGYRCHIHDLLDIVGIIREHS